MKLRLLYVCIILFLPNWLAAQSWESTGGPIGGLGYDVRIDPVNSQIMYLTDNFVGVLKSTDGGASWVPKNSGIEIYSGPTGDEINIFSLTIDENNPDTIWAGSNSSDGAFGIFKSIDGGENWNSFVNGINAAHPNYPDTSLVFRGFTVEPGNSAIVYAQAQLSTGEQGATFSKVLGRVFKSSNGGQSWNTIWEGDNLARYLIVDPSNISTLYLSTGIFDVEAINSDCDAGVMGGEGVLKSIDGGQSWKAINNGIEDLYLGTLRMHPQDSQTLYAGGSGSDACQGLAGDGGGLYRTIDGGENWERVAPTLMGGPISTVNFSADIPTQVYAAFEDAIYHSADNGTTWNSFSKAGSRGYGSPGINAGIPIDIIVHPDQPNVVFANNYGGGLFKSIDSGQNWNDSSRGFSGAVIYSLATSAGNNAIALAAAKSGVFRSSQYGSNWLGMANGEAGSIFEGAAVAAHPVDDNIILQSSQFDGKIYRSVNGGSSFKEVYDHPSEQHNISRLVFAASNPDIVYATAVQSRGSDAADAPALLKSTDGGQSFSALIPGSVLSNRYIWDLAVNPADENLIYIATSDPTVGDDELNGALIMSDDGGQTFSVSLADSNFGAVLADADGTVVVGALWGAHSAGIYKSTNNGQSWSGPATTGLGFEPYITDIVRHPTDGRLFAAELYSGVYVSNDNGQSWDKFPLNFAGLGNRAVNTLAINEEVLYAGTQGGGVYRYAFTTLQEEFVGEPSTFVNGVLDIPVISAAGGYYNIQLILSNSETLGFQLWGVSNVENPHTTGMASFVDGTLSIPNLSYNGESFRLNFLLTDASAIIFTLVSYETL
jgi:photosystem II stability/assembly factor-like uncharacterized protein